MKAIISDLHWYSDWNGDEVGYPEIPIVGMYSSERLNADMYINVETGEVIELWLNEEEYD